MLYKKNLEKKLSDELFEAPTAEYRATPFWAWNCKMTPEILEKQISYLKEMGYGGFHMHSRVGMDNEYLSDDFMSLVRACVDKAKREDMLAWLYDEDKWPSGFAGGIVTREPEYRSRMLCFAPASLVKTPERTPERVILDVSDELPFAQAVAEGKPYYLASYDVRLDENGYLVGYEVIGRRSRAKGEKWVAYCCTPDFTDWYNGYCYVDTLSKKAVKRFIEVTHEAYKAKVGDEFDKTVPAIFTDEPQFTHELGFGDPFEKKVCKFAWTPDLPRTYKKAYRSDIIEHIPELFWDLAGGTVSLERYHFRDHLCERFTEAFSAECGKWCSKNGIQLTGHMLDEPTLKSQTGVVGEAMRAYKYFGFPGIDMLCNRVELTTAKQTQSVVHQYGKEGMLSELYGVTNWDFDLRGHKFQGDWQAALGVTIRVPHLSWVSMKGDAKRDYPASFNYQTPWYKEYPYIEDHFARVNTALTRGRPDVSIAVIHPIESYWLHAGPGKQTAEIRLQKETDFENCINWLLFAQLDFDYISESLFPGECKKASAPLEVGKMKYSAVVVPGMETMRRSTLERLSDFCAAGGKLIFMGECPKYVDGVPSDEVKVLYASSVVIPFERLALLRALESERKLEIRLSDGSYTDNYIYNMRMDGSSRWLFIANAKRYAHADVAPAKHLYIKLKGCFTPTLYDTLTGEIKPMQYSADKKYTRIELDAYLHDSFLIRLDKGRPGTLRLPTVKRSAISKIDYKTKVAYKREEPNVLLLDIAEWKWDDRTEYQPAEEIRRLDAAIRVKAGIPPKSGKQPWCLPAEIAEHTQTLRFTFASETVVRGAEFACEDMDESEIFLDGKRLEKEITGYFTDECIKTTKLPELGIGTHSIEVKKPLAPRTYTENCFLLGDFNVRLEGCEKTLTAATDKIGFGNVTAQGMPFYGGNISYFCDIDVPQDDCTVNVHTHFYKGALVSVRIDGGDAVRSVFAPYNATFEGITKGKHTVEIKLFGNRYNSFSALHVSDRNFFYYGPRAWVTGGDSFSYEYQLSELGVMASPVIEISK